MKRSFFILAVVFPVLTACSSRVDEGFKRVLNFLALSDLSALVLVSNSTTETDTQCTQSNTIVIQKSFPAGRTLYCRDTSSLNKNLPLGEVCPGGVSISEVKVDGYIRQCSEVTVCGVSASSILTIGKRVDGGTIDRLRFENLPWGCEATVEFSFDPKFSKDAVSRLQFYVQPPECPFCPRQNKSTCLPCTDLSEQERIQSGQVVLRSCGASSCKPCEVLHQSGEFVAHGEGKVYFKSEAGDCRARCREKSLLRVCNNGFWQGDPAYEHPQCVDQVCGCTLPGDSISYAHNRSKRIYATREPACGVDCDSNSLLVTCNDGTWEAGDPQRAVSEIEFSAYPEKTCAKKICHCVRSGRATVADGTAKTVFSRSLVSCSQSCQPYEGRVQCQAGRLLAEEPRFLSYAHDSCAQEDCGCRVTLADGSVVLVANGGSTTLFQYDKNSVSVPDACHNTSYQAQVTCTNKSLSGYDRSRFRYRACAHTDLSCTFTEGAGNRVVVNHGARLTVSKTSQPDCGVACENLTLTCDNTVLKKEQGGTPVAVTASELARYHSASACTPRNCDCRVNGHIIPYGRSDSNFYKTNKATDCNLNGCTDARATLTCEKTGAVSSRGDDPLLYQYKSCEVALCGCAVPWGGTIESGKSFKAYSLERAGCSDPAACQSSANFKTVTCTNGALSNYDADTYRYPTCSPPVCECTYGPVKVPFNETLKVYKSEQAPAGELCSSISAVITCGPDGVWSGAQAADYPYVRCSDLSDDGIGDGTGGGTGNDEGPGSGIKRRLGLGDGGPGGGGGPCLDFGTCRSDYVSVSIAPFGKDACVLPWGGGEVEFYASVAAFNTRCVTPPDKCSNHRTVRTCHFPAWTGGDEYKYPSCEEKSVCP